MKSDTLFIYIYIIQLYVLCIWFKRQTAENYHKVTSKLKKLKPLQERVLC